MLVVVVGPMALFITILVNVIRMGLIVYYVIFDSNEPEEEAFNDFRLNPHIFLILADIVFYM